MKLRIDDLSDPTIKLEYIKSELRGDAAVNFFTLVEILKAVELPTKEQGELVQLVMSKVLQLIQRGNWRDLRGAKQLFALLDITEFGFAEDTTSEIIQAFNNPKLSYDLLLRLSPNLHNGMLPNGAVYERNSYTRKVMQDQEITDAHLLSDNFIAWLWAVREILVYLHSLHPAAKAKISPSNLVPLLLIHSGD